MSNLFYYDNLNNRRIKSIKHNGNNNSITNPINDNRNNTKLKNGIVYHKETFRDAVMMEIKTIWRYLLDMKIFYRFFLVLYMICFLVFILSIYNLTNKLKKQEVIEQNISSNKPIDEHDIIGLKYVKSLNKDQIYNLIKFKGMVIGNKTIIDELPFNENIFSLVNYLYFKEIEYQFINEITGQLIQNNTELNILYISDIFKHHDDYSNKWYSKYRNQLELLMPYWHVYQHNNNVFTWNIDIRRNISKLGEEEIGQKIYFMMKLNYEDCLFTNEMKALVKRILKYDSHMSKLLDNCKWYKTSLVILKKYIMESIYLNRIILQTIKILEPHDEL